jgi:hypothetical protein
LPASIFETVFWATPLAFASSTWLIPRAFLMRLNAPKTPPSVGFLCRILPFFGVPLL